MLSKKLVRPKNIFLFTTTISFNAEFYEINRKVLAHGSILGKSECLIHNHKRLVWRWKTELDLSERNILISYWWKLGLECVWKQPLFPCPYNWTMLHVSSIRRQSEMNTDSDYSRAKKTRLQSAWSVLIVSPMVVYLR